ncbi:MAG: flagellar hook-associated protein FlgK [Oxalobacteraceae bacterium]
MSDLLGISSGAVMAYQRALGTVSNNIANVGTDGYVRQETVLAEAVPRKLARMYVGTGVYVDGIRRAYDEFLEKNLRNSTSELNTQQPMVDFANRIVDIMGSDSIGLPPALNQFFESARLLSTDPSSNILRAQFLRDADGVAGRFRELSSQLGTVDTETREATNNTLDKINTLTKQIAVLNKQMVREVSVDRQSPELLDQRDRLLKELSQLVKINVSTAANGAVDISLTNSAKVGVILRGQKAIDLEARFDDKELGRVTIVADPYDKKNVEFIAGIASGELGGLLAFREQMLQPTMDQLDFLANTLVDEVNAIHTNGIDREGNVGQDLFSVDPVTGIDQRSGETMKIDRASAGIKVAIDDTARVAAGALFRVIENDMNLSNADATLSYATNFADTKRAPALSAILKNNPDPSAGINATNDKLLGQIPLGSDNWTLYLDNATNNQQLQVFTRDGRQLIGAPLLDDNEARLLINEKNGFFAGSTYSTQYLNQSGNTGYKQSNVFYGLKAKPVEHYDSETQFNREHDVLPSARHWIIGDHYGETIVSTPDKPLESIAANTLAINGKVLPQLLPTAPSRTIQASDIANWMNRATFGMVPTVSVNAQTTTTLEVTNPSDGFYINGIAVPPDTSRTTLTQLASYINQSMGNLTNVEADVVDGKLVLANAIGYGGRDIRVAQMDGEGKLVNEQTFRGVLKFPDDGSVTIGYGPDGKLGDLDVLGRPVGDYYASILPRVDTTAIIESVRVPSNVDRILGEAITLNGKALGELDLKRTLQASDMASWMNDLGQTLEPPVTASASTEIKITRAQYRDNLATKSLKLNGVDITGTGPAGSFTNVADLVEAINSADTGDVTTTTDKLDLSRPLDINGVRIVGSRPDGSFASATDMINAINAQSGQTGVSAKQMHRGDLEYHILAVVLKHHIGDDIVIGPNVPDGDGLKVRPDQVDLTKPLVINGATITGTQPDGSFASQAELIDAINAKATITGVSVAQNNEGLMFAQSSGPYIILGPAGSYNALGTPEGAYPRVGVKNALSVVDGTYSKVRAEMTPDGTVTLANKSGADIVVGSALGGNVLGVGNGPYKGTLKLESKEEIRVSFAAEGNPAELAKLGLRTGVYFDGPVPEDLIVMVTGEGSGTVAGSFDATMKDPATLAMDRITALRAQKFDVTFTSGSHYQITWKNPANGLVTVLAERDYDPLRGIEYQGLKFTLNKAPVAGDTFLLDGNHDGTGNNQTMLDLVALQSRRVIGGAGGRTIAEAYEETVGKVGNFSNQATIAQKALQVVNDQAIEARDKISGVSLDEEAADLIRFQQAYQASAKAMQVANTLFDAILQV